MNVHLIGVAGTGMGSLAGLLARAGHDVRGSDTAFNPPMGDALARWGVQTMPGWNADNLDPTPDLVVVGNVCRSDNPEARAAIDAGLEYTSLPGAIERLFLDTRPGFVVAGTHGKTTTTALVAHLLHQAARDPSFLIGGIPQGFRESFRLGAAGAPFVIEGDEYDSAFFEKNPKFLRYRPKAAIVTSIEHDHIDIYPDEASYLSAFRDFVSIIPPDGLLVAYAGDPKVREVTADAQCEVVYYALDTDDCGKVQPVWMGAMAPAIGNAQPLDLFAGGSAAGRWISPLFGKHNARNLLAAIAMVTQGAALPLKTVESALGTFGGVKRRQELMGEVRGIRVYDDFAHHPTAVRETLAAMRQRHPDGKLLVAFEPRSATACRRLHQDVYPEAFALADGVWIAPLGRKGIPGEDALDIKRLRADLSARGAAVHTPETVQVLVQEMSASAEPGDTLVLMSNGTFGGAHSLVLDQLRSIPTGEREVCRE